LNRFLDGNGALANRDEMADRFDYDWHARKLKFEENVICCPFLTSDLKSQPNNPCVLQLRTVRIIWGVQYT
jgi:hypothetical protein